VNADHGGMAIGRVEIHRPEVASQPVRLMPRPVFLAGREELLAHLDARLSAGNGAGPRVVALCGLGGVGKTSVALEYAHRHLARLGMVWQFHAEDPMVLEAGFGDLAVQLGVRVLLDTGDPVVQVHAALAARPAGWLLIFDNAPGPGALQRVLPPAGRGQVLITSQNPHWPGQAVEVPVLGQAAAAAFLLTRTGSADQGAAGELAAELGRLPLALEQAGAYMQSAGRSIAGYLDLFLQRRADLLARGEIALYDKQVATTWELAFAEVDQGGPAAGLLRFAACCAAEDIPLHLLLRPGLDAEFDPQVVPLLMPLLGDDLTRDDAVAGLRRYSLISAPHDGLVSVHRLVQAITLDKMPADLAVAWRQATAAVIEAALPEDPENPAAWPVLAALLPHAQAALTPASYGIGKIVTYLRAIGNNAAALVLQRQILDTCEADLGVEDPRTLTARASLATLTAEAGYPPAALGQFAELVPVMKRVLGEEHPATLIARSNLARLTGDMGDPAAALGQFAELVPVMKRVLGEEHPATLDARSNLARLTGDMGDPAAALSQFAELLSIRKQILGDEHPATLTTRASLAYWTGAAGNPVAARDQYAAELLVRERVLGEEHPAALTARSNLARWTGEAGNPAAAREQYAALLPVWERVCGTEHPRTLADRASLAHWSGVAGDLAAARDQYAGLLPVLERVLGSGHPNTLTARCSLAYWARQVKTSGKTKEGN
jgi:hypothetical protein